MKIRNGFISNSSSSNFLLKLTKPWSSKEFPNMKNRLHKELESMQKYDPEDVERIEELKQLIQDGWISIRVEYGAEETVEGFCHILKNYGIITKWKCEE